MGEEDYRYYRLDGTGWLHGAEWFEAASDGDAIAQIEAKHPGAMCEVWQGQRLVGRLAPGRLSPSARPNPSASSSPSGTGSTGPARVRNI